MALDQFAPWSAFGCCAGCGCCGGGPLAVWFSDNFADDPDGLLAGNTTEVGALVWQAGGFPHDATVLNHEVMAGLGVGEMAGASLDPSTFTDGSQARYLEVTYDMGDTVDSVVLGWIALGFGAVAMVQPTGLLLATFGGDVFENLAVAPAGVHTVRLSVYPATDTITLTFDGVVVATGVETSDPATLEVVNAAIAIIGDATVITGVTGGPL